ncbi:MAG: hypothetical protein WAV16_02035 [Candidatus Moraniibacteriota bacterium]
MTEKQPTQMILTCNECHTPLNARAISSPALNKKTTFFRTKPELFCPKCDVSYNLIRQFKKQLHEKKTNQAKI